MAGVWRFFGQLDIAQQLIDARFDGLTRHVVQPAVDHQILLDGQFAVQVDVLGHQAELFLCRQGLFFNVMAAQRGRARGQAGQAGENPDRGGFACAVGAQVGEQLGSVDR